MGVVFLRKPLCRGRLQNKAALVVDASHAIEIADRADEQSHRLTLDFGQVRIPTIHQHHYACRGATVPSFVLERVVEGEALAFAPFAFFAADDERAILGHDQRQMRDETRVGHATMRQDMCARAGQREPDGRGRKADRAGLP